MIETLGSATATESGGPTDEYHLELTGILFRDPSIPMPPPDLSRPRYPSLIDLDRAPAGVQFEPCLQIRADLPPGSELLKVRFEIAEDGVDFVHSGSDVTVRSILSPLAESVPGVVSATLIGNDPKQCELVWDQKAAEFAGFGPINILRLFCKRDGALSALEEVEGGIYLAILNRPIDAFAEPDQNPPGDPIARTVKMLGFDSEGRAVFDLFRPEVQAGLKPYLTLEPAFRCREGQIVSFSLVLDLPDTIDLQFVVEPEQDEDQVMVAGFVPSGRPLQLADTTSGDFGGHARRRCSVSWYQETGRQYCATSNPGEARRCYCTYGQGSSFALRATVGGQIPCSEDKGWFAELDPTVIQPPSCTSTGICITP